MKMYLVRHGDYFTNESQQNVLSEKGINEITQLKNFLMPLQIRVATFVHSGKTRAQQTALLLAPSLLCDDPPKARQGLNPHDDVLAFANEMVDETGDWFVVGHLPFLSKLVGQLVAGNENKEIVYFHTGTMVCLELFDTTRWLIQWVWNPASLTS
jgi:phosphohistidine phosphatase